MAERAPETNVESPHGLLDPENSFSGLNLPVEQRPAALAKLAEKLDKIRQAEQAAYRNLDRRICGNTIAATALIHTIDDTQGEK